MGSVVREDWMLSRLVRQRRLDVGMSRDASARQRPQQKRSKSTVPFSVVSALRDGDI